MEMLDGKLVLLVYRDSCGDIAVAVMEVKRSRRFGSISMFSYQYCAPKCLYICRFRYPELMENTEYLP